jgi:hypothetical protein
MRVAILASGESMSQEVADSVRGEYTVLVVNNVYQLAPWADGLVANDHDWWRAHKDAIKFDGRKFSSNNIVGVERVFSDYVTSQSSSGVLSLEVARSRYFAKEIHLYGFDNKGSHYFGQHVAPLNNTTAGRFEIFQHQFKAIGEFLSKCGVKVINKTPGSALRAFPFE